MSELLGRIRFAPVEVAAASPSGDLVDALRRLLDLRDPDGGASPLRVLADHLPLVVWVIGEDERVQTCFGRALARLGLAERELEGVPAEALGEEGLAMVRRALGGEPVAFESEGVADGRAWAMHNLVHPLDGGGAIGLTLDTTELAGTRRALEAAEGRFEVLARNAPVGIFIADPQGDAVYLNDVVSEHFGRSAEELAAGGWREVLHPDDAVALSGGLRRMLREGEPLDREVRVRGSDREERWVQVVAQRFLDDQGEVVGSVGTTQDVTARRRRLAEIVESEERFRRVAESAPLGMFLSDGRGGVAYANGYLAELLGVSQDELLGTDWLRYIHPDDVERVVETQRDFREGDEPFFTDFRVIDAEGREHWVRSRAGALFEDGVRVGAVGTVVDITDQRLADARLRESEELTTAILETAAEGIVTFDEDGTILAFNAAAERIFGWDSDEILGRHVTLLLPEPERDIFMGYLRQYRATGETVLSGGPARELPGLRRDSSSVPIELAISEVHWGGRTAFTAIVRDISERKEFERALEHQATHDPLTALPNRSLLAAQLESALARAYRNETSVAVLFISLDRMKLVTDSLGHRAGDELRVAAAHRLQSVVRSSDTVTRFGENEFVILAEDLEDLNDAVELAQQVIEALDVPFDLTVDEAFISANVGIAFALDGLGTAESLISDADVAMFRARERGGSHFEIFDSEMRAWVNSRRKTENALRHGLERDEFELHYQPIVGIESREVKGFEALVRWDRPHLGLVPPGEFIPVAEESGIIIPLGEWILHEACRQAARWQQELPERELTVAVNLSGRQLAQRDIADTIALALEETGARPDGLVIELTETMLLDDVEQAVRTLDALREIGVTLSIDDFGTGYSSLTYLRRFPIDIVKVDRSFVNQLGTDSREASIVEMVVTLAHGLELEVVAEGVETDAQLEALARMRCHYAQGYLFARPQPVEEAAALLNGRKLGGA